MPRQECISARESRCLNSRASPRDVNDPETVRQRLFKPRPFQSTAAVGNPQSCISVPRNTEKMFPFYSDLPSAACGKEPIENSRNIAVTDSQQSSQQRINRSPPSRWSTGPINPLWGNVLQPRSSPKSWSLFRSDSSESQSCTLLRTSRSHFADSSSDVRGQSLRSGDYECCHSVTPSLEINDRSNLSPAMLRALKALSTSNNVERENGLQHEKDTEVGVARLNSFESTLPATVNDNDLSSSQGSPAQDSAAATPASENMLSSSSSSRSKSPQRSLDPVFATQVQSNLLASLFSPHNHHMTPNSLEGEFVSMKDTLDPSGGIKVGFGGLSRLQEHVAQGLVNKSTVLALEFEFCTHGFDCVSAGDILKSKYYRHYMEVCDVIESALSSSWNICFLIKRGRPRKASFEIQVMWLVGSVEYSLTLASKLCTKKFPSGEILARRLCHALDCSAQHSSCCSTMSCGTGTAPNT